MKALIFDCDGVLADTERDGHRVAFNEAFAQLGCGVNWDAEIYKEILKISGGKERIRYYFNRYGWPEGVRDRDSFVRIAYELKTDIFLQIVEKDGLSLRPGVARLVDEAIEARLTLAVCSTASERAVNLIVEKLLGQDRKSRFDLILAGDVVTRKKPDPEIYNLALQRLGLRPEDCVVIEDSRNGLLAAKGAGMYCVITTNAYTEDEDFREADLVVSDLGDYPLVKVSIQTLLSLTGSLK